MVYDVFDSNETLEGKLLAGRTGYDVVVPSNHFLARQAQAGAFMPLERDKLPNWKHWIPCCSSNWSRTTRATVTRCPTCNEGTNGIGYNVEKVKAVLGIDKVDSGRCCSSRRTSRSSAVRRGLHGLA